MSTNKTQADPISLQPETLQIRQNLDRLLQLLAKEVAHKLRVRGEELPTRRTHRPKLSK